MSLTSLLPCRLGTHVRESIRKWTNDADLEKQKAEVQQKVSFQPTSGEGTGTDGLSVPCFEGPRPAPAWRSAAEEWAWPPVWFVALPIVSADCELVAVQHP